MTTDTEALRRAFEAFSLDGGLTPGDLEWNGRFYIVPFPGDLEWNGRFYIVPFTQDEWLTFQAGHAAAKAETAWIPVAVLPAPCLKVIATYVNRLGNRRTIMAKWVPGKTEEAHSLDDEFGEYDEATDTTYAPEGWYEVIDNFDDCTFVAVSEGVITHWMPLPEAPDAIRAGATERGE